MSQHLTATTTTTKSESTMHIRNRTIQDTITKLATSQPPQPKQHQQNGTAVCKPLTWSFLSMSMKWSRVFSWADISGSNVPTLMKRSTPQLFRALVAHTTEETRLEMDTCIYTLYIIMQQYSCMCSERQLLLKGKYLVRCYRLHV